MKVTKTEGYYFGELADVTLTDKERQLLLKLGNEETEEEILDMIEDAQKIAHPKALFGIMPIESGETVKVGNVVVDNGFVEEKLRGKGRCFPYIVTCGTELNEWAEGYRDDPLADYWADEIKLLYMRKMFQEYYHYVKEAYHVGKYFTAVNPGSLEAWPISGEKLLFEILGGKDFVYKTIGVYYSDSFLMIPNKSSSGIEFDNEVFYENCMYCPREDCPNRRAPRVEL